jgi:CheY-like chemotaxis protein
MRKVLLVDDHPIVVSACRPLLEDDGCTSVFDANGIPAGYQAFLKHRPDVVVVDLKLHGQEMGAPIENAKGVRDPARKKSGVPGKTASRAPLIAGAPFIAVSGAAES